VHKYLCNATSSLTFIVYTRYSLYSPLFKCNGNVIVNVVPKTSESNCIVLLLYKEYRSVYFSVSTSLSFTCISTSYGVFISTTLFFIKTLTVLSSFVLSDTKLLYVDL
jgi:hypothetical protein